MRQAELMEESRIIKEVKDKLLSIFDGIGDGISVINKKHQISRVNRGILRMFNKGDFHDLIGKTCFTEYQKRDEKCEDCPAERTFRTGEPERVTRRWHGTGKRQRFLEVSTFPIKGDRGEVVEVIECVRNATNTVRLEDELLYQERLGAIGELAAGVAHEIRNPLGNINAAAQFCLQKYKLHQLARKHLKIILRNSENANRIIKGLIDFARPRRMSLEAGDIGKVIDGVCELIKPRCSRQRVRLSWKRSRRLRQVLLDRKQLEGAFMNFTMNALDAMPDGGSLVITAYPEFENNTVVVTFLDTGDGIPKEDLDRVFNPFFTTKSDGVGLGLCLARQVIQQHKGKVGIESDAGHGTKVTAELPMAGRGPGHHG